MDRAIVIVSTMDTKGDMVQYLQKKIEGRGHPVITVDIGIVGPVPFKPTYNRDQVAAEAGSTIQELINLNYRPDAMGRMKEGAIRIVEKLHAENRINGIVVAGGSQGTAVVIDIVRILPTGFPKVLITTVAYSPIITPEAVSGDDLMMVPWIAGLYGLNSLVKNNLDIVSGAVTGAAEEYDSRQKPDHKIAGITSLGTIVFPVLEAFKKGIESRGWEAGVFHVNGVAGRNFEKAISDGLIQVSLDLNGGIELLNLIADGAWSAGPDRLEAAGKAGIPQIVSPGAIGAFHWGKDRPLPERYQNRVRFWHNALLLTVLSTPDEAGKVGALMAKKLNKAKGPTVVVLPMKGVLSEGMPTPPLPSDPPENLEGNHISPELFPFFIHAGVECMAPYRDALKKEINPNIRVIELDAGYNDSLYVETVLAVFDEIVSK